MAKRGHISWKTKYASALLALGDVPYVDAKQMTEDQIISLYHLDHNMLHSSEHEDRDRFWNLRPMMIRWHRQKTKADVKIVAKSKRIQERERLSHIQYRMLKGETLGLEEQEFLSKRKSRIKSRGFDKTLRKKLNGRVEKR